MTYQIKELLINTTKIDKLFQNPYAECNLVRIELWIGKHAFARLNLWALIVFFNQNWK